jgi:hypothetical protein
MGRGDAGTCINQRLPDIHRISGRIYEDNGIALGE